MPLIERTCEACGNKFAIDSSRLKWGRGRNCSKKCQSISVSKKQQIRIQLSCFNCGELFSRAPSTLKTKKGAGKYCCRKCRDNHRVGKNHPDFINNKSLKRGHNWQAQKRKALYRDNYTCQTCDSKEEVVVHHIIPYRFFQDKYRDANSLSNLITLCSRCHRIAELSFKKTLGLFKWI